MKNDLIRFKMDNDFIEVRVDIAEDGSASGTITSNLHAVETEETERYNNMINAMESLILAHACERLTFVIPSTLLECELPSTESTESTELTELEIMEILLDNLVRP